MNHGETFNRQAALSELFELKSHIDEEISCIENGRYDPDGDLSYEVGLDHLMDHLMDHLVRAWHFSRMTDDEIGA